jgi:hypothetical protein
MSVRVDALWRTIAIQGVNLGTAATPPAVKLGHAWLQVISFDSSSILAALSEVNEGHHPLVVYVGDDRSNTFSVKVGELAGPPGPPARRARPTTGPKGLQGLQGQWTDGPAVPARWPDRPTGPQGIQGLGRWGDRENWAAGLQRPGVRTRRGRVLPDHHRDQVGAVVPGLARHPCSGAKGDKGDQAAGDGRDRAGDRSCWANRPVGRPGRFISPLPVALARFVSLTRKPGAGLRSPRAWALGAGSAKNAGPTAPGGGDHPDVQRLQIAAYPGRLALRRGSRAHSARRGAVPLG